MSVNFPLPTIHLNGTGLQDLRDGYKDAYYKVEEAIAALRSCGFHARDYYVQGSGAFASASDERNKHFEELRSTLSYLEAHMLHLYN